MIRWLEYGLRTRAFRRKKGEAGPGPRGGDLPTTKLGTDQGEGEQDPIVCRACENPITIAQAATSVGGSHLHTFMNPGGFVYEIACYSDAPGTFGVGEPSTEWSWFPGSSWQVVVCSKCHVHIGWRFRSRDGGHHGLIRDRLSAPGPG